MSLSQSSEEYLSLSVYPTAVEPYPISVPTEGTHDVYSSSTTRVRVGAIRADNLTSEQAVVLALKHARLPNRSTCGLIASVNARAAGIGANLPRFAKVVNDSVLSLADGMSIVFAARLLGTPLAERIPGVDLVEALCRECASEGLTVYFLGGRPGAAERSAEVLQRRYPALVVGGIDCPRFGFEHDPDENERVLSRIRRIAPDLLFVGLGTPKQEYWIEDNAEMLGAGIAMGVGGAFELLSGLIPRAPRWLQSIGMEWAYRLAMEPRRLWRRYLTDNAIFILILARQILAGIEIARSRPTEHR